MYETLIMNFSNTFLFSKFQLYSFSNFKFSSLFLYCINFKIFFNVRLLLLVLVLLLRHLAHQQIWKHHENFILAWRSRRLQLHHGSIHWEENALFLHYTPARKFTWTTVSTAKPRTSRRRGVIHSRLMVSFRNRYPQPSQQHDLARN